ncbi:pantetheinase [Caerostris darwini]|uniref:Pantetheinase n=1 Tax=Caerostris darwini TaxID=1538125 RepID=A0AAV4VPQ5_9ARAC|nr:pantetheinase [Caerostris darwini]
MQNRISCATAFLAVAVFSSWAVLTVTSTTDTYFTGAVFEFVQTQHCTSDPEEAMEVIQFNLDIFVPVAVLAKSKGADIIVFPEYSIFPECSRDQTALFCEVVPDPKKVKANPCVEAEEFADRTTLRTLSCMARNNSIVVQANMGDMQKCEGEPGCPPEGHWQYNTNVVFDKDGTIIARYRKEHLWQEYHFDLPQEKQDPKFTVDFGTYLSYVCFDIFLERIIEEELDDDVDGVLFSTMWENTMPMGMTVEFFQAWVMATNLTLLAACIQLPGQMALGSGLFHGQYGALAYTYDPDGLQNL